MRILPRKLAPVKALPLQAGPLSAPDHKVLCLDATAVRAIGVGAYASLRAMLAAKEVPVAAASPGTDLALAYGRSIILRGWLAWQQ